MTKPTAHSTRADTEYPTWDDLIAAETNGYSVVSILQRTNPKTSKTRTFARVTGPFPDQKTAQKKAASLRLRWKLWFLDHPGIKLVSVNVEPLWNEL